MRIQELHLDAFGHFSGKVFDFGPRSGDRPDFHVIYGPNEAGKTTTMEAFLRLLYGFPARDPYDFRHQRKNLQISGVVDLAGDLRTLTRLPKRSADLLDENGQPLPDAAMSAHLGGLSETDYRQLLCLDDHTIEQGGEAIANSKGDIGRLLFSAAAGIGDLSTTLDQMRGDADVLYKPRGSKTRLAELKRALKEVEKEIRATDVTHSAFRDLQLALDKTRETEQALRDSRDALRRDQVRALSLRDALPLLHQLDQLDRALAPFDDYPRDLDLNAEDLVALLRREDKARADQTRLAAEIAALEDERDALPRQPEALTLTPELEALQDLFRRQATARVDLPKQRATQETHLQDMRRIARDLNAAEADPTSLVVTLPQLAGLEQTLELWRDAQKRLEVERQEITRLKAQCDDLQAGLNPQQDTATPVSDVLARFTPDTLAPRHAAALQAIQSARDTAIAALDALAVQDVRFDTLPPCPTTVQDMADFTEHTQKLADQTRSAQDAQRDAQRDVDRLTSQIAHIRDSHSLVDDTAAQSLLDRRDALWQSHIDVLSRDTARDFETAMRAVDTSSDTRLTHASALGELRHKTDALLVAQTELTAASAALDAAETARDAAEKRRIEIANAAGLPQDTSDKSLAAWCAKHETARTAEHQYQRILERHQATLEAAGKLTQALEPLLSLDTSDFETLLSVARQHAKQEHEAQARLAETRQSLAHVQRDLKRRQLSLEKLKADADAFGENWREQVAALSTDQLDPEALAHDLTPLRLLREVDVKRREAAQRVTSMERDQHQFATQVSALAKRHGLTPDGDPQDHFHQLTELARGAQAAEETYTNLSTDMAQRKADQARATATMRDIAQEVASLARLFPAHVATESLNDLRLAVGAAQDAAERARTRDDTGRALCAKLGVETLADARAMLTDVETIPLEARIGTLERDLATQESALEAATTTRVNAERDLRDVTGGADVAILTEHKATLELQIEEAALQYLELDLGHRLAEEAIRRYRDTHRSDMLAATEAAFAQLTDGAYPQLRTQPDGANDILIALDTQGVAKQAQDMSKGTRFQLYLALRAAAYQQLSAQGLTLPFFCDDIFETFDETRTRAACRVMQEIGRTGQAIYLTHHAHVVDIARDTCPGGVTVHQI